MAERRSHRDLRWWIAGAVVFLATFAGMVLVGGVAPDAATAGLSVAAASLVHLVARLFSVAEALARSEAEAVAMAGTGLARSTYRELLEEKRRVLAAIKELDFDHAMGKLSDADHRSIRARYERRAAEVLRALDEPASLHPWARALAETGRIPGEPEGGTAATEPSTPLRACPSCNGANDADARFCKHCGEKLAT
ncbi:MAG: zinc ribbon domain-containing protein [Deltaproteobacteria bacterium]|nr:MAG: zinc ribbon domain-containing protein [Deltaproteobacteria bacterium]